MSEKRCIFCLTGGELSSTTAGCEKVRWAVDERQDAVLKKRLDDLELDEVFSYHMTNSCYKSYTDKNKVARAAKKLDFSSASTSQSAPNIPQKVTRSQSILSQVSAKKRKVCIIRGRAVPKDKELFRICEVDRANRLLEISNFYKDDVFTRTCCLQNPADVFAADLYYYGNCWRAYE